MSIKKDRFFDGINKALSNASDLITDAEILLNNNRFSRAYTLYHLSMEETGKASMLFFFLLHDDYKNPKEQKRILKEFRDHKLKTQAAMSIDMLVAYLIENKAIKKKLIENLQEQERNINHFNDLKNNSLYTSFINNKFYKPSQVISEQRVKYLKFYAEIRLSAIQQFIEAGIENYDDIVLEIQNIDKEEFINNPPKRIRELVQIKISVQQENIKS